MKTELTFQECADDISVDEKTVRRWARKKRFAVIEYTKRTKRVAVDVWRDFKSKRNTRAIV